MIPTSLRSALRNPSRWVWIERILLLAGIACLAAWAWARIDARLYEREQNRRLEEALATGRRAAAAPEPAPATPPPASETDSFESFREGAEQEAAEQRREEEEEGVEGVEEHEEGPAPAPLPADQGELVGRIEIPRVGVSALVLEGVGKRTLRRGAGHIPATALPSQGGGNVGIAAHRDSFFRGLKDIRKNDTIELTTLDGSFRYAVEWTRIVEPEDTHVLEPTEDPALTLVTCYPFYYVGSAPKRFIVRARRVGEEVSRERSGSTDSAGRD